MAKLLHHNKLMQREIRKAIFEKLLAPRKFSTHCHQNQQFEKIRNFSCVQNLNNVCFYKQRLYSTGSQDSEKKYQSVLGTTTNSNEILRKKQVHVYDLLSYINSPIFDKQYQEIELDFNPEQNANLYESEAYETFMDLWKRKMFLPQAAVYLEMNDDHLNQVKAIFGLLYTAKDYDAFYRTAIWARRNINERMFLYIFSVAVFHREDTQGLAVPPIHEIYPHHFFNREIMKEAEELKNEHFRKKAHPEQRTYTVRQKYSDLYNEKDPDKCLSYFREDIGVAGFYYCFFLYFPKWMSSKIYQLDEKRGELFYYVHQQLALRHYLERLSVGVGHYDLFDWNAPFSLEHNPPVSSPNGVPFSARPKILNLKESFLKNGGRFSFSNKYGHGCSFITDYENRIEEAIDLGYVHTSDGKIIDLYASECTNLLANIIEGNEDSVNKRYYGTYIEFARQLFADTTEPLHNNTVLTTSLNHYETCPQDPALHSFCRKMTQLFQKYKAHLPPYTTNDMELPGVTITNVESTPLVTFFEKYYTDITNGMTLTPEEFKSNSFRVQVEQYRLNNKPFEFRIQIKCNNPIEANMKIFIGPKCDEKGRILDLSENRMNFLELDQFIVTLKSGQNNIIRKSENIIWFGRDRTKFMDLYSIVEKSKPDEIYQIDDFMNAYPQRYMLPRGKEDGMPCQLYIIIFPYKSFQTKETQHYYETKYNQETIFSSKSSDEDTYDRLDQYKKIRIDSYPMGFPFDRPVETDHVYYVPNAYQLDVTVYHEALKDKDLNK